LLAPATTATKVLAISGPFGSTLAAASSAPTASSSMILASGMAPESVARALQLPLETSLGERSARLS
jgi:hypothetical protein